MEHGYSNSFFMGYLDSKSYAWHVFQPFQKNKLDEWNRHHKGTQCTNAGFPFYQTNTYVFLLVYTTKKMWENISIMK